MGLTDIANARERLKLITLEYSIESDGHFLDEPIVELFCRDERGNRRMIEVEGFYPFFYITESEFTEKQDTLLQESMIRSIDVRADILDKQTKMNGSVEPADSAPRSRLDGTNLVRITTVKPSQVSKLRDFFDWTGEADVFFTNRFLVATGIHRGLTIPEGKKRVSVDEIEALDDGEEPDVSPRLHTVDIEVWSGGDFPDTTNPRKPVTAITAHDSYSNEYFCGVLHPDAVSEGGDHSWDESLDWRSPDGVSDVAVEVYTDENQLLGDYFAFVDETDPDLMTGWNSSSNDIGNGFDYPYLVNRADVINEWSYQDLTYENGRIFVTNGGSAVIGGREMFDMLQAYKKTQIHEKRSYSLEYIAQEELGQGKEDIADLDEGWLHNPVEFMEYNIRDVSAVIEIEQAQGVLELYDNIRSVAGCTYSEAADSNIGIIDVLFLRQAKAKGIGLPTSTEPERGWYYGAKVFNPSPGKHRNVVYPDLASLYPYLMWSLNVSPETIFESLAEAREAGYSEDELYRAYADYRNDSAKRDSDPDPETIYYVKPEVKTGFVRDVVDDMVDMKYEYKGEGKKYAAVKRITNSLYGVFGDSNSYGVGFRLFDWRLAETITIAGRKVLQHTADEFTSQLHSMGYTDARLIGGDTDSVMTPIPSAESMDETLDASFTAAKAVNASYDAFMCDTFDICDPDSHKMEVEIESYADALFFLQDLKSDDPTDGVKKKYSQTIKWDEGETIDDPEPETKGFKLVRSDTAALTGDVQQGVLRRILTEDDPKASVKEFLQERHNEALDGEIDPSDIGIPSSISSDPMDYGWSEDDDTGETKYFTPQPHIRGARYATAYIDGEDINSGAKPLMFYVEGVRPNQEMPETYDYSEQFSLNAPKDTPDANKREMKELDREVDAIAVEDARNIPEHIDIDWEKMAEKTIEDAVTNIAITMGWDFDDLVSEGSQSGLSQFM
jgi:DNA polymerase elongation subunit (family B)